MAFVKVRVPRTSQPQVLVGIDPYWIGRGLTYALIATPQGMIDVGPLKLLGTYPAGAIGPFGVGSNFTGSQSQTLSYSPPAGAFTTRIAVIRLASNSGSYAMSGPSGGFNNLEFRINNGSISVVDAGVSEVINAGSVAPGENCTVGAVYGTGRQEAWKNGMLVGTNTATLDYANLAVVIGQRGSGSEYFNGLMYAQYEFTGMLTQQDMRLLTANPWQIFEPEERLIWIPDAVSVGGGATVIPIGQQATGSVSSPTATGAATTSAAGVGATSAVGTPTAIGGASVPATVSPAGVVSASSVGTPTATGASVTSANGVQAISAVGTPTAIAGTSIPATVTPAGVIAHASIGSLIATGAAWTVTGGVQAASAVGSPTAIAGTSIPATALPAGVSAMASVGTPSSHGASIAYASGISAFSAVGAPTAIGGVSGQATALPAGVQAISYVGVPTATAAAVVYAYGVQAIGYVGMPIALGDPVAFTPSVYQAISPAQSYTVTSPAQSYTAISPAQSYTVTVQPQIYIA